jgi:hypothetical protein
MFTLRDLFGDDERIDRKAFVFCSWLRSALRRRDSGHHTKRQKSYVNAF